MNANKVRVGRMVRITAAGALLLLPTCGRHEMRNQAAQRGAPAEVVQALKAPESPHRIIYHPPVDLAKRASDSTRAARARPPKPKA